MSSTRQLHIALSGAFLARPDVGSGQYLLSLLQHLPHVAPQHRYSLLLPATITPPELPPAIRCLPLHTPFDRRSANLAKLFLEQVAAPQTARMIGADLLHVPYFAPPLRSPLPVVVTVHDLIPLLLPEYRGGLHVRAYMQLAALGAHRADHLLADSFHTRDDLRRVLGIPASKITTVRLCAAPVYRLQEAGSIQAALQHYQLHHPLIYYVGGFDARKNVELLLRILPALRARTGLAITLALAGRLREPDPPLLPDLQPAIQAAGAHSVRLLGFVPDQLSAALYAGADAVAFPSRYEGFGLPALEALACAAALAVSNASSLPEIVGAAALLLPPTDAEAWISGLSRLLTDPLLNAELRRRAAVQAAQFSAELMVRQTLDVYAAVAR